VRLALVEADGRAPVAGRIERAGAVFWVAAGAVAPPPGLSRAAAAERYLVTPGPAGGKPAAFVVAGCTGRPLGRGARRAA
jgi:hypothetical protein